MSINTRPHLDFVGTLTIGTLGGTPTARTTAQRSYNHLAILKHHRNNNKHKKNNAVSTTHTEEKCISSSHSNRGGILCHDFVSNSPGFYFSAIYLSKNCSEDPTRCGIVLNHRTTAFSRLNRLINHK